MNSKKFWIASILFFALMLSACNDDSGVEPVEEVDPPIFALAELTIPQALIDAANAGDPGASMAYSYFQLYESFYETYSLMFNPPEGFEQQGDYWIFISNGITYKIYADTTDIGYSWTYYADGSDEYATYNNFKLMELEMTFDGDYGTMQAFSPELTEQFLDMSWAYDNQELQIQIRISDFLMRGTIHDDGDGIFYMLNVDGTSEEIIFEVMWDTMGNGIWTNYLTGEHGEF